MQAVSMFEVTVIGHTTSLYSSSASWLISHLMNRGGDPANGLSVLLQNRVTIKLAQGLRNSTKTSVDREVSKYDRESRKFRNMLGICKHAMIDVILNLDL